MQDLIVITISKHEFKQMLKEYIEEIMDKKNELLTTNEPDKLLSIEEACQFLNLAKQTLYGYTSKNLIPYIKKSKKLYFKKSELIKWLNETDNKSIYKLIEEVKENSGSS